MGRTRSARALQLVKALAGERLAGVKRACAGGNIWGGFFEPSERGRRSGSQGSRNARGGVLERTLGCGGLFRRRQRGGELLLVGGRERASDVAVITLRKFDFGSAICQLYFYYARASFEVGC